MTPFFALSFAADGIRLLHRAPDGWDLVGEVPLDTDDLGQALSNLRDDARKLGHPSLACRLVIPPDQIRFDTLDDPQASRAQVEAALDGTTPYALDELAIDYLHADGRTHLAACALETLDEARAFASDNGFEPVCFVAEPRDAGTEIFFGPVDPSVDVARETIPPVATGTVDFDRIDAQPDPAPSDPEPTTSDIPKPEEDPDTPPLFTARPRGPHAAAALPGGAAPRTTAPPPAGPEPQAGIGAPGPAQPAVAPRGKDLRADSATLASAPKTPRVAPVAGAPEEPLFTHRKAPPPAPMGKGKAASAPALRAEAAPRPERRSAIEAAALAPGAAADTALQGDPIPAWAASPDRGEVPGRLVPTAPAPAPDAMQYLRMRAQKTQAVVATPPDGPRERRGTPRFMGLILTGLLLVALLIAGFWASTLPDEGISWLWGSDETAVTRNDAAPADAQTAGLTQDAEQLPQATAPVAPALVPEPPAEAVAPSVLDTPETGPAAPPLPVVRAPTSGVLTPAEADRIYAATGVYQRAPRIAVVPRVEIEEAPRPVSDPLTPVPTIDRPVIPVTAPQIRDVGLPAVALADPPPADTVFARDLRGRILATPDGTILPSGAVIIAGAPDLRPRPRPGTPAPVASAAPASSADPDLPEGVRLIVGPAPVQPRPRPAGLAPADRSTTTVRIDTPEAATTDSATDTPEGVSTPVPTVTVTLGAPDRRPPLRPDGLAPVAITTPAADAPEDRATDAPAQAAVVVIQGAPDLRPALRPISFSSLSPRVTIQPAPAWLTASRPLPRPEDLAPEVETPEAEAQDNPEEEPVAAPADINAITAALAAAAAPSSFSNRTARAVGATRRPDLRPRDFASTVARARSAATQRQAGAVVQRPATQPRVAAPATAAPVGRPPATVARAATQDNAVNLRRINLVGVFGRPNARRALVRLSNGRYVKVEVGSSLDGGRVTAIGDSALNFVKRGRTYALQLPTG